MARSVALLRGVDVVWRTESRMGRIVGTAPYRRMTTRSWATTTKLLALLDAPPAG